VKPQYLVLALALVTRSIPAQEKVDVFGYFEPQYMGLNTGGKFYQLSSNKLRLDLQKKQGKSLAFGANFDFITYHGSTDFNALDFLPRSVADSVPEAVRGHYRLAFTDRIFLDNAFVRLSFGPVDITAGKQQISLGTGYAWNPIDIFNFKNILDPTYENPGHNAVRLDLALGNTSGISTLFSPAADLAKSAKLVRFRSRAGHFDYSLTAMERGWEFTRYPFMERVAERRRLFGFDTAGELLGLGVWLEAAFNDFSRTRDFWEMVAGVDYTFDNGTYSMAEYYRNTGLPARKEDYRLGHWMRYLTAEMKSICRDQLYLFTQYPATDLLTPGLSAIGCLDDGSIALVPQVVYSAFQNLDVTLFLYIYLGGRGTVYSSNMGNGGLARVRFYF